MAKYKVHTFTSSSTFQVSSLTGNPSLDILEYLVIGGGGSGGVFRAGGGGAGGYRTNVPGQISGGGSPAENPLTATVTSYTVTVGAGGTAGPSNGSQVPGNPSVFGSITSTGGGSGGGSGKNANPGGSGGGGAGLSAEASPGSGTPGQGYNGGIGLHFGDNAGAGGGGAGGNGSSPPAQGIGGAGGPGQSSTITGTPVTRGGGGGGGVYITPGLTPGPGGPGGGGPGGHGGQGTSGTVNTGGGGGGGGQSPSPLAGFGGSGIVIVRYPILDYNSILGKISRVANVTANLSTLTPNNSILFTVNTINAANGEVLYYSTNNQPNAAFTAGNTGSFVVNANVGTVTLTLTSDLVTDTFTDLQVRRGSATGTILKSGGNVYTFMPTFIQATGGVVTDSGGYRIHAFTTSGSFEVTTLGSPSIYNSIDYLVLAGGGGAGGHLAPAGAGGGGAGGHILTNRTISETKTFTISIGGGGAVMVQGGPSSVTASPTTNFTTITATGGGRGGGNGPFVGIPSPEGEPGGPGGSGGGAVPFGPSGGSGISGQGNPGWIGGGGGAGSGGPAPTFNAPGGVGITTSWIPPAYGTPGPTPGRWLAGGGGYGSASGDGGTGGAGGGGNGGPAGSSGTPGQINTGGGGGGANNPNATKPGGSGIVLIRYPIA